MLKRNHTDDLAGFVIKTSAQVTALGNPDRSADEPTEQDIHPPLVEGYLRTIGCSTAAADVPEALPHPQNLSRHVPMPSL